MSSSRSSRNPRSGKVRLERALSKRGIASRAQARAWILAGRVRINGVVKRDPDLWVIPEKIKIEIEGTAASGFRWKCFLLHKPKGVVTTRADEKGRKTVFDLLPPSLRGEGELSQLHCVGRLDQATSGLLLLTNDTRFSDYLTDPRNAVARTYVVVVRGEVSEEIARKLEKGVQEGSEFLRAHQVGILKASGKETHLQVVLKTGKNREVRRLLESVRHEVTRLKRVAFGGLELGALPIGMTREISRAEAQKAFPQASFRSE